MKKTRGTFTYYLVRNFWWKLASLILATLIWLIISNLSLSNSSMSADENEDEIKERVLLRQKIHILTVPSLSTKLEMDPSFGSLTLRGPAGRIDQLNEDDVVLFVKPPEKLGSQATTLRLQVHLPPGLSVLEVDPLSVILSQDKRGLSDTPSIETNTDEQF